jgi:transposase-like protein
MDELILFKQFVLFNILFNLLIMDENTIEQTVSNIWVYLWVCCDIRNDTLELKYAVEAVAKLFEYNALKIKINSNNSVLTELEAVDKMLEAFQNYKLFLTSKGISEET